MNFQIMQHVGGREFIPAYTKRGHKPLVYSDPKRAAVVINRLTAARGGKFQLRPMAEMIDWREREKQRFASGEYKPVVWANEAWWQKNTDHFAHISVKDPTCIAFTRDDKSGAADIQTKMKPGKYLTEFFGHVLSTEKIRTFAMQHSTTFETTELKFATTPEEIERVYAAQLGGSCFSGTKKANLYGSGDFAVAYIEKDGKITARAVCAVEKKIYPRCYGDYARLGSLLAKAGYKDKYDGNNYAGLRLLKSHYWQGWYGDWGNCYAHRPHPTEPDKYYIVG